ncbi:CrcB family protein [Pseudonocardia nematodicida]|uniref:Fluoride-specific ion channel FluC n=1 Tax=Pseudonocardia nematodicida TaxID=1206997 RepID=A0ABV1K4L9_9PSEU
MSPGESGAGPGRPAVLGAVAAGGVVGAETRYLLALVGPAVPWATLLINVTGCLLMGVLMVLVTERERVHPLARPALGVGVLGGYTTFSTYATDVGTGDLPVPAALALMVATPLLAVVATAVGARATRVVAGARW